MSDNFHVSDGRVDGGKAGSIVFGILVAILFNWLIFSGEWEFSRTAPKILHLFLSLLDIPIAVLSQKVTAFVYDFLHNAAGDNADSVYVSTKLTGIIFRKYAGAFGGPLVFELILIFLLHSFFSK
jgi:hypothetical protein